MSAVSTARPKKQDPLQKKVKENPKYAHVEHTVDTGASVTRYLKRIEETKKNYRYKKDEIFKRMKVSTFVQLIVQVEQYNTTCESVLENGYNDRPDSTDYEIQKIQGPTPASPTPTPGPRDGDRGDGRKSGARSTLQGVVKGVGEVDTYRPAPQQMKTPESGSPYLLLDIRDADEYKMCHIISALNYPKAMLSRVMNYETKEMLAYKNSPGKIIMVYDEDERIAPEFTTTLVQRGYDNIFMLSGGMKVAYKLFPEGFFTGTPNENITEGIKCKNMEPATQTCFTSEDINKLDMYINGVLSDKSSGSRLSHASTVSSRMGQSTNSKISTTSSRPPFK